MLRSNCELRLRQLAAGSLNRQLIATWCFCPNEAEPLGPTTFKIDPESHPKPKSRLTIEKIASFIVAAISILWLQFLLAVEIDILSSPTAAENSRSDLCYRSPWSQFTNRLKASNFRTNHLSRVLSLSLPPSLSCLSSSSLVVNWKINLESWSF